MQRWLPAFLLASSLAFGCGDEAAVGPTDGAETAASDTAGDVDAGASDTAAPADATKGDEDSAGDAAEVAIDDSPLGGDRPARVVVPPDYVPGTPRPLLILLHGYSASGPIQDLYLGLSPAAAAKGFITIIPDGTRDPTGLQFWNASPGWCCNFSGSTVDDVGYLLGLVDEASQRFTIDPGRVYLLGHSNGGFMAHTLACEHAERFAAIAVIAGSMPLDPADCAPSEPVAVLQIHGTLDAIVFYGGAAGLYPGSEEVVKRWAGHDRCELLPRSEDAVDYDAGILGDETVPETFPGCSNGAVELWQMRGSGHVPLFSDKAMPAILDWLLAHPKS